MVVRLTRRVPLARHMPPLREGVLLRDFTTLKVGGPAHYFTGVATVEELKAIARFAKQNELSLLMIGGGSNLLVADSGFSGVVVKMEMTGVEIETENDTVRVRALAGMVFDELVAFCSERGYWGLENLSHIPGTVGATPIQNVGAYGVEVSDCIVEVTALHIPTLTEHQFTNAECEFGYRSSFFKTAQGKEYVVTSVTFALAVRPQPRLQYADLQAAFSDVVPLDPKNVRDAVISIRSQKFPDWHTVGTAGSFFKNPIITRAEAERLRVMYPLLPLYDVDVTRVKCSLGFILDKVCGLRGYRKGQVRLYERQALVLVAEEGATASDIEIFSEVITEKVFAATGIKIEREVRTVNEK